MTTHESRSKPRKRVVVGYYHSKKVMVAGLKIFSFRQVAKAWGCSPSTVFYWKNRIEENVQANVGGVRQFKYDLKDVVKAVLIVNKVSMVKPLSTLDEYVNELQKHGYDYSTTWVSRVLKQLGNSFKNACYKSRLKYTPENITKYIHYVCEPSWNHVVEADARVAKTMTHVVQPYSWRNSQRKYTISSAKNKRTWYYGISFYYGHFDNDVWSASHLSNNAYYEDETDKPFEWSIILDYRLEPAVFKMYKHNYENKVAIAFRGTASTWSDIATNFYTNLVGTNVCRNGTCAKFHSGYYSEYMSYRDLLISKIQSLIQTGTNPQIIVTGHSQGGGLAQLCAVDLALTFNIPTSQMKLITFAAPAPGDYYFSYLGQRFVNHLRIVSGCNCAYFSCIYLDMVENLLTTNHFGTLFALQYRFDPSPSYITLHSLNTYIEHVKLQTPYEELTRVFALDSVVTSRYQGIYVQDTLWPCSMQLSIVSTWDSQRRYEVFNGRCDIPYLVASYSSDIPAGIYDVNANITYGLYSPPFTIRAYPNQIQVNLTSSVIGTFTPSFTCPSQCVNCSEVTQQCTSCKPGYYGTTCEFRCPSNCATCMNSTACLTCASNVTTPPPQCAPKCSSCVNGLCIDSGVCKCNDGWTGVNCSQILCPAGCTSCSSPYQCTGCKNGWYGITCSSPCLANCLTCSNSVSCSLCAPGYYGSTCSNVGYSTTRSVFTYPIVVSPPTYGITSYGSVSSKIEKVASDYESLLAIGDGGKTLIRKDSLAASFVQVTNASFAPYTFTNVDFYNSNGIITTSTPSIVFVFGNSPSMPLRYSTVPVLFNTSVQDVIVDVTIDSYLSFYLTASGRLYVYGDMSAFYSSGACVHSGILGRASFTNLTEIHFPNNDRIKVFDCVMQICFAYSYSGRLYGWGHVSKRYYGIDSTLCEMQPLLLDMSPFNGAEITAVHANNYGYSMFLTIDGRVFFSGIDTSLPYTLSLPSQLFDPSERVIAIGGGYDRSFYSLVTRSRKNYVLGTASEITLMTGASRTNLHYISGYDGNLIHGKYLISQTSCFGVYDLDPTTCSGNGKCANTDLCVCNSNYAGQRCEKPVCFGFAADDQRVCSGKGQCIAPNVCSCQSQFTGSQCELFSSPFCSNVSTVPYQCPGCVEGSFNTVNMCRDKCPVNCISCNSSTTCQQCSYGYSGSLCTPSCPENCRACSSIDRCSLCHEGFYLSNSSTCEPCPENCNSCHNSQTCTSCKQGWNGATCTTPVCLRNCRTCTNSENCTSCVDGYKGDQCFTACPVNCQSCNSTQCVRCKDGYYGNDCEYREERCDSLSFSMFPTLSSRDVGNGQIEYTISVSKFFQPNMQNSTMRVALKNIRNCSSENVPYESEISIMTYNETKCEWIYMFRVDISSMMSDRTVSKQLDASGNIYTLKIPFYIAIERPQETPGYCSIVNYNINHEIKILLDSHQYIEMSYTAQNLTTVSYRRDVIAVQNKTLTVEGRLFISKGDLTRVTFVESIPVRDYGFDVTFYLVKTGEYYLALTTTKAVSSVSGTFRFNLEVTINGTVVPIDLVLDLQYYMPYDPPSTNLQLSTRLALYDENFQHSKLSFSSTETPNVLVQLVSSSGNVIPNGVGLTLKNAYLCCMKNGYRMPTFDLSTGQLGCTVSNSTTMSAWLKIIDNHVPVSMHNTRLVSFPNVNFQIGFAFTPAPLSIPVGTHTCFIHTESKLLITAQQRASRESRASSSELHSYEVIQFTQKEIIPVVSSSSNSTRPVKSHVNGAHRMDNTSMILFLMMSALLGLIISLWY
ncbi:hypothetical protein C9374_002507 [Naegleria lovaniensis]|uniref:EGF-like domain-containing protein n=1 Tax=Naegleria lovaniensis TaxID=51637 RepID=A0AA88GUW4_NAELO|nr:uncharacterized protein C9374_002507 [Naegleria lovaniensis]KAG2386763.1 hypothetical protein C9374_002507 [Naegleria lovaniensis]